MKPKLSQLYRYAVGTSHFTARLSRRLFRRSELKGTGNNIRKWLDPSGEVHPQTWENIDMFLRTDWKFETRVCFFVGCCFALFRELLQKSPKIQKYGKMFGVDFLALPHFKGVVIQKYLGPKSYLTYMLMCFNMRCTGKGLLMFF